MATLGITQPGLVGRSASGPSNVMAPAPGGTAHDPGNVPFYASGPFWVLVFLGIGYILVFQTLK